MLISNESKDWVVAPIQKALEDFNRAFSSWMEETGCRANFGWEYGADKAPKKIVLLDVDARIYQRPLPEWATRQKTVDDLLNKDAAKLV